MQNDFFGARSRVFIDVFSFLFAAFFFPGCTLRLVLPSSPGAALGDNTEWGAGTGRGAEGQDSTQVGEAAAGTPLRALGWSMGRSPPGISGQEHLLRAEAGPWTRRGGATRHTLVWTWSPELGRAHACIHLALGTPPGARPGKALGGTETWTLRLAPSPHGPGGAERGSRPPRAGQRDRGLF